MPVNTRVLNQRLKANRARRGGRFALGQIAAPQISFEELEAQAEQEGPGVLLRLGQALSVPGDLTRGFLTTGTPGEKADPREFLRRIGLEPSAEFTLAPESTGQFFKGLLAGTGVLATDILTDPLSLLTGVGQLGKGAAAFRGAQKAVRRGRTVRRAGREVVENIKDLPRALRKTARELGSKARATPEEIAAAGGLRKAPRELLGKARELQREEFARARKLFAEAEKRGVTRGARGVETRKIFGATTQRPLVGIRGLVSERAGARKAIPVGGSPFQLGVREGFQAPRGARGARDLLQVGIPLTRFRGRVPGIPRAVERAIGSPVAKVGAAVGFPLQKIFGRTGFIPKELQQAERFFAKQADTVQGLQSEKIAARQEELVLQRATEAGIDVTSEDAMAAVKEQFNTDIRGVRESSMSARNMAEQEFADSLNGMVDARTFAQYRRGARDDTLIDEYAERILSTAGRKALREKQLLDPYKQFIRERFDRFDAGAREGSQIGRRDYLPELTNDANEWFREKGILAEGENFFSIDAAQTVSETIRTRSLSTLHANLAASFVDDLAGIPGRAGDLELARFLRRLNMKGYRGARWKKGAKVENIRAALRAAGIENVSLPFESAVEFEKVFGQNFGKIGNPAIDKFLRNVYDPIASLFRVSVTAPFPAFHIRNFLSNSILNFMGGVRDIESYAKGLQTYVSTNRWLAKKAGIPFDETLRNELTELGVLQGGQLKRIMDEAIEQGGFDPASIARGDVPESVFQAAVARVRNTKVIRAGFGTGEFVEDSSRLIHYLSKRKQGLSKLESVESVNKFLFDYSNKALNGIERTALNRIMYFYRWNRFAIPLVLKTMFEHPNRAAVVLKGTTQPAVERPAGIPEFIRESAGIPAGVDPETGETSFISRFGSPFEVLEFIDPTGAKQPGFFGQVSKLGREFFQQTVPMIRFIAEAVTGEEFFLGREIADLDKVPALQALFGELLGSETIGEVVPRSPGAGGGVRFRGSPNLRFAARQSPTSRLTSTVSRIFEQPATAGLRALGAIPEGEAVRGQRSIPQELLRTLAGVQISEVDTDEEVRRRARRSVRKLLDEFRLTGEATQFPVFAPTEKGRGSAEVKRLQQLLNQIGRAQRGGRNITQGIPERRGRLGRL